MKEVWEGEQSSILPSLLSSDEEEISDQDELNAQRFFPSSEQLAVNEAINGQKSNNFPSNERLFIYDKSETHLALVHMEPLDSICNLQTTPFFSLT